MDDLFRLRQSGKHTVIEFRTPTLMNQTEVERIRAELIRLVEVERRTHLVLDFSEVQYFSSQVIGVILTLNKKLTTAAGRAASALVLCGIGPQLIELLRISRLDRILTIKPNQTEAINS